MVTTRNNPPAVEGGEVPDPVAGGGGQNPNPNPVTKFSLTPGKAIQGILDYESKEGKSYFNKATSKLEDDELYDCSANGFFQFMKSLETHADEYGWNEDLLQIPTANGATSTYSLLTDYGRISLGRVKAHATSYIDTATRKAQDDRLLYECLLNSLSIAGKSKINLHQTSYTIGQGPNPSGIVFLKILIQESYLDSNATTGMIRTKLSNLDVYMAQVGNDIKKFNSYVTTMTKALAARGETSNDLLTNLFKGYAACSDKTFVKYIGDKQTDWEEGTTTTPAQLMDYAETKFKILKTKEVWEAPSAEEEQLLALETRFAELKKKLKRKNDDGKKVSFDTDKKRNLGKQSDKRPEKPAWLKQNKSPPDADLKKTREWNKAHYSWCCVATGGKCGGKWRVHKPSECKGSARDLMKGGKGRKTDKVVINDAIHEVQDLEGGYHSN
jgi:hypothetical protein